VLPLETAFEGDREDDGSNEIRLAPFYQAIFFRGDRSSTIGMISHDSDSSRIRALCARAARLLQEHPAVE